MAGNAVFMPIRQIGELVRTRQVSPVELAETFLGRLEELGPRYNAVVTLTRDRAMEQAERAEQEIAAGRYRGPLHGIPYGAKDLLATSGGIPTTWGAAPFRNQVFDYDATVVRRLEEAGAVLVAKLAMIELAGGMGYQGNPNASFTGPCRSPWDANTWAGGSSSGSGSAVGGGMVPFAIGSETWGSILSPANNCGVAGLRPTFGRVSRYGAMALSWTLDKLGPLALTADDCGLVLDAIAGSDPNDETTTSQPYSYDAADVQGRRFNLAVLKDVTEGVQDEVRDNFLQALKVLEQVADIEEIEFPDMPYEGITRTILNAESASAFEDFIDEGKASELSAPEDHYGPYARTTTLARDYIKALRLRGKMAKAADETIAPFDALVGPSRSAVAPPIEGGQRGGIPGQARDIMGAVGNGAGLPAVSVPSGFNNDGLPTGIQFMGRAYDENKVLTVARAYQSMTDWHTKHPAGLIP